MVLAPWTGWAKRVKRAIMQAIAEERRGEFFLVRMRQHVGRAMRVVAVSR
jgi:hypothetical protein